MVARGRRPEGQCVRQRSLLFTSPAPPLRLYAEAMTIPSALNRDRAHSLPSDLDALRQRQGLFVGARRLLGEARDRLVRRGLVDDVVAVFIVEIIAGGALGGGAGSNEDSEREEGEPSGLHAWR